MLYKKIFLISVIFLIITHIQYESLIKPNNAINESFLNKTTHICITSELYDQYNLFVNYSFGSADVPILNYIWGYIDYKTLPPPRIGFSFILNPINKIAILFGGLNSTLGEMNDMWITDGHEWIQFQTPNSPQKRFNASMTYNEVRQEVFLFGGTNNGILLGDTWLFSGVDWIMQSPINSPSPRVNASMVYDPDRNQIILFGGQGNTGEKFLEAFGDMWVWDGTNWQQQFPANLPPARFGAGMVYDEERHLILLFGGGAGGGLLDDTWIWDGTNWTEKLPVHHPLARADFGMTYDESRQQIILYGGQSSVNIYPTDTWAWGGNDWEQLATIQEPPPQLSYGAKLVYLPELQTVILVNDDRQKPSAIEDVPIYTEHMEVWELATIFFNYFPITTK